MSNPTDWRALCAIAVELWDADCDMESVISQMRAALAQPEPVAPTDEELVNFRNRATADCCASRSNYGANLLSSDDLVACQAASLRAVLTRYARPTIQPVPVSERLPGPEDCDAEGRCWYWHPGEECWEMVPVVTGTLDIWTHWLPHYALPTP